MSKCGVCKKEKENMKSESVCVQCAEKRKEYYKKNSEKIKKNSSEWRLNNKNRSKKYNRTWHINNKEKLKEYKNRRRSKPNVHFSKAKMASKRRGIEFILTLEQYTTIINNECYYCSGHFGKVIYGSGLDRLDNSKGYTNDNVVSCCKLCNRLKSDWLSSEEAKAAIETILKMRLRST